MTTGGAAGGGDELGIGTSGVEIVGTALILLATGVDEVTAAGAGGAGGGTADGQFGAAVSVTHVVMHAAAGSDGRGGG